MATSDFQHHYNLNFQQPRAAVAENGNLLQGLWSRINTDRFMSTLMDPLMNRALYNIRHYRTWIIVGYIVLLILLIIIIFMLFHSLKQHRMLMNHLMRL